MTKNHIDKLKTKLPKNYARTIAENLGLDQSTVRKVINGTRTNTLVLDEAIKLAEETALINLQRVERIDALANNTLNS